MTHLQLPPLKFKRLNPRTEQRREYWVDGPSQMYRARIPGGWLLYIVGAAEGITFVLDPDHKWNGASLD